MMKKRNRAEDILGGCTLVTLVFAALIGLNRSASDISAHFQTLLPGAERYEASGIETYKAFNRSSEAPVGYITIKQSNGFGGPLKVAVGVDAAGVVVNAMIVEHRETPSWFAIVEDSALMDAMKGKRYKDHFEIGSDIDGISGATYTTRAVIQSVKAASREIALNELNLPKPDEKPRRIQFGFPEIILLLLLAMGTFGIKYASGKTLKRIRWVTMLAGMAVVGFMVNHPLTLVDINKFLMGYWPDVHYQLYWYLLTFGVLLIFLTTDKNYYCHMVCPFGAAQECLAVLGKAKSAHSKQYHGFFKWLRRAVVWLAVCVALIFRNPGISSYEVYSTIFSLSGTNREVLFLVIVLVFSLFMRRPWCKYLCPVPAFSDYLRFTKSRLKALLSALTQTPALKNE